MTVFIFNTSKQVGDSELLRSSPAATPPKPENDFEGVALKFWNEEAANRGGRPYSGGFTEPTMLATGAILTDLAARN